jgi:hypothetical protein
LCRRWVVSGFAAVCFLFLPGCSRQPSRDEPRHYGPKINLRDLLLNTANYKGRILTLALEVSEAIDRGQGKSLRDYVGQDVHFTTTGPHGERISLVIKIPPGVSVPEVGPTEQVSVTFLCTRGNLREGNEAKIIEKPNT